MWEVQVSIDYPERSMVQEKVHRGIAAKRAALVLPTAQRAT